MLQTCYPSVRKLLQSSTPRAADKKRSNPQSDRAKALTLFFERNPYLPMKRAPFVFISYSRKDYKVAADLQRRLEKYPYPKNLVPAEARPDDDKYIRPVFLDVTDLSMQNRAFSDEIKENIAAAKYLLVVYSEHSAQSDFVKREIEDFYETHGGSTDCIVPVIVGQVLPHFHPIIDPIVELRNCPIYKTEKSETSRMANRYCFYRTLEYMLHVDFDTLFNRYQNYKRRKMSRRIMAGVLTSLILIGALTYGWVKTLEKLTVERQLVQFERKTFPYSLVVGYLANFMTPMLETLTDSLDREPHVIIFMPANYNELDHKDRLAMYTNYIASHYPLHGVEEEIVQPVGRSREISTTRLHIGGIDLPLYIDNANTVSAFKYVVDYKMRESPTQVHETRDEMVICYSEEFINSALDGLGPYAHSLHFVTDTTALAQVLDALHER